MGFPESLYLVLFTILLCIILVYLFNQWLFIIDLIKNLDLQLVNFVNRDLNFPIVLCKVEFNQPSCWLYSMPNLLVFQHLVTLYLGGIVVRVVSEIECWNAQECARKQSLAIWSRGWLTGDSRLQAARSSTRAKHAGRWTVMLAGALQDKTGQLAIRLSRDWISRLSQVASHPYFVKPDVSHSSHTPV